MPHGQFLGVNRRFANADLAVYFFPSGDEFDDQEKIIEEEHRLADYIEAKEVRWVPVEQITDLVGRTTPAIVARYSGKVMLTPTIVDERRATLEGVLEQALDPEWGVVPV